MNIEIVGLMATILILVSFLMNEPKYIRIINAFGALLLVIYGFVLGAVSVYLLNGILIAIHVTKLIQIMQAEGDKTP